MYRVFCVKSIKIWKYIQNWKLNLSIWFKMVSLNYCFHSFLFACICLKKWITYRKGYNTFYQMYIWFDFEKLFPFHIETFFFFLIPLYQDTLDNTWCTCTYPISDTRYIKNRLWLGISIKQNCLNNWNINIWPWSITSILQYCSKVYSYNPLRNDMR